MHYTLNLFSELGLPWSLGFASNFIVIKEYQKANKNSIYKE
jgi:NADH:ubiquinone oxidoreductase subunit 2 (subunit N)